MISSTGRPQEIKIFRFLKTHWKIAFHPSQKFFSPKSIARNLGSDGKMKILTLWATCSVQLATLLQHVATCLVLLAQIGKWPNFSCNIFGFCMMLKLMMQSTANETPACLRRICKISDQPKIERLVACSADVFWRGRERVLWLSERHLGFKLGRGLGRDENAS